MTRTGRALLGCVLFLAAAGLPAHDLRLGSVSVRGGEEAVVTATLPLSLFDGDRADAPVLLDQQFRSRLRLRSDQGPFVATRAAVHIDKVADEVRWTGRGPGSGTWTLDQGLTPDVPGMKTRFALEGTQDQTLVGASPATLGSSPARIGAVIATYLEEGVRHILTGWDHLCFLLALLLGGGSWRRWFKLVSAFTLAHSLTLSLAVLGFVAPSPRWIEPLIALSIVVVAVWNLAYRDRDFGFWWALGFGLLHGFGFAGALGEVGVPAVAVGWALGAFNVGVELGQVAAVAAAGGLLALVARTRPQWTTYAATGGSSLVAVLGATWFASRILGGI